MVRVAADLLFIVNRTYVSGFTQSARVVIGFAG